MRRIAAILFALAWVLLNSQPRALAQMDFATAGGPDGTHHTQVKLLLSADSVKPGDTIYAGVDMKMDAGWHTYWKNPGEAGTPTKIDWKLPAGVTAGEILWPLPEKLPPAEVTTYGYEGEVMLIVPLTVAATAAPGTLDLAAKVSWLECKESCLPADTAVAAKLTVANATKTSGDAAAIESWKGKTPQTSGTYACTAAWEMASTNDTRPLLIRHLDDNVDKNVKYDSVDFFPAASDDYEFESATEALSKLLADVELRKSVKKYTATNAWPARIKGTIVVQSGLTRVGYDIDVPVSEKPMAPAAGGTTAAVPPATTSLAQMLLYAFIGGLILNIMPCVLPVIALKILGFVGEARSEPRRVRLLGITYTLGVLASFLALAGIVIGVRAAGHQAGWGMQFSSPVFIVCLTTLVMLVALNLFGVFEVTLGGRALDTASNLASRSGVAGAFFNGVLATTLATPCTAPFLAPALGFAFAQSTSVILLIFLAVGVGLSAPYIVLSWHPGWLKFLPKPGAWMEKFKIAMGFPMLATMVWLFNVAASSYGKNVLWLGLFLVMTACAAWVFGEFVQRGRKHKLAAGFIALVILGSAYGYALESQLDWRTASETSGEITKSPGGIDWQPWSPEAVATARAAGKPVLVDFTADWCLTCQVNKKTSLENASVQKKLKDLNAVALIGDYTHFSPAITTELNRYHQAGVPLVLVFPKEADAPAIVLPSVLTPGIVLAALEKGK